MGRLAAGPKVQRRSLWQHIEMRDREMQSLVQAVQVQNAALKLLLDGFREVPLTKKCRSRWVGRDEIASLRKLLPTDKPTVKTKAKERRAPQMSHEPAVA